MWSGSANLSASAFFGQFNYGHIVHGRSPFTQDLLRRYRNYWEVLHNDTQNERDDSKTKLKALKSRCDELSKTTPLKCALCPQSDLGILNTFADLIRNAKQAVFLSVPFWLHDVIGNAILGLSDGTKWPNAVPNCFAHNEPCTVSRSSKSGRVYYRCNRTDGSQCRFSAFVPNSKYCSCKTGKMNMSDTKFEYKCESCKRTQNLQDDSMKRHHVRSVFE